MIDAVLLVVIAMVPILGLWFLMSRHPVMRWVIAGVLFALLATGCAVLALDPRGLWEVFLASLVLAAGTAAGGLLSERLLLGPGRQPLVVLPTAFLAAWLLAALCCGAFLWRPQPFHPDPDLVLPLPSGLSAEVGPADDGSCGSGACLRYITVTGRPGQSDGDLEAEVGRHLVARGWSQRCRPAGWWLDQTEECAAVTASRTPHSVTIELTGRT